MDIPYTGLFSPVNGQRTPRGREFGLLDGNATGIKLFSSQELYFNGPHKARLANLLLRVAVTTSTQKEEKWKS